MEDAFATAVKSSTTRRTKDAEKKLHFGPCLGVFETGNQGLNRSLRPRGGPGNLRYFGEKYIAKVLDRHDNGVTY